MPNDQKIIKVYLDNLRCVSTSLQKVVVTLSDVGDSIASITTDLNPHWIGNLKDDYTQNLQQLNNNIVQMEKMIEQRKSSLDKAMSIYEANEAQTVSSIDALSIDNIF